MKTWKKVLLETGIFTAVFALGAGTGFLSFYHKAEEQLPTIKNDASGSNPSVREETPTDKYLNNLVATKALEGDVHLTISAKGNEETPTEDVPTNIRRGIEDIDLGDINLDITNIQLSIADLENIKLSADLYVQMSNLELNATLGYFDSTIYLDCFDTHFQLKTDDIFDFMDMLPTFGIDMPSTNTLSLDNLDIDGLTSSLANMEETIDGDEHYFMFNFNEDIAIKLLSDDEYHMVGVELPECNIKGMTVSATSDLHSLSEEIEGLINPSMKEGAPEYIEFKNSFTLINRVMDLVNSKKANVGLNVEVNKMTGEGEEATFEDFISLEGDINFDINELKVLADLGVTYSDKTYRLSAGYQDETIYAGYKNLKVSITNQSVLTLTDFITQKLKNQTLEEALDKLGDVSSEVDLDLDTILTYVNDLSDIVDNFELTSNSLSMRLNASYFKLGISDFDIAITWNDESLKTLSLTGLCYGGYQINASLNVNTYQTIAINPCEYIALDPAISLVSSIDKLINQDTYGVSFTLQMDDGDPETNDLRANGLMHFTIRDKTENDVHILPTKRTFNYGSGELTIYDGDNYPHNIIMDAQPYTEDMTGKVLLSYGGTSDHRTNARINYSTFDELFGKIKSLTETNDSNISQLIGGLMSSAEASPISQILNASDTSDYLALLDYDIITHLDISATEINLSINGDFLGFGTNDLNIRLRYEGETIKGLDIIGLQFNGKTINFSGELLEFNQEVYEAHHLEEDSSYIDISTISQFAEQTINTLDNNYYHIAGPVGLKFTNGALDALASLFVNKTMNLDAELINDGGHISFVAHITDIPTAIIVSDGFNLGMDREAWLIGDINNADGESMFYVHRHDSWWMLGNQTRDVYSKYNMEGFKANLMTVFMSDMLGLSSTVMSSVTNIENNGKQIQYENIIDTYDYSGDATINDSHYNGGASTPAYKYTFSLNIGILAQSDSLEKLSLDAYVDKSTNQLSYLDLCLSLTAGVGMKVNADLFIQDTSVSIEGKVLKTNGQTISSYMQDHANDPLNARK